MSELVRVQKDQVVTSSRKVAESFEKRHDHVVRDIGKLIEDVGSPQNWGHLFIASTYNDSYDREQKQYLLTRDGFTLLAMGFTGKKALEWKLKYIEAFNKMENAIKSKLSPQEIMRIQLGMLDNHEGRIDKLENTMTIDYGQQQVLRKKVNARVMHWLEGKHSVAYKSISKKVFSECNRDIQDYFNVNSRNNIPKLKFDDAIDYIESWEPKTNTKMLIRDYNAQLFI